MGLHETVKQVLDAYNAIAGSAERAEQGAARMEQHERRTAAMVDQVEAVLEGIKNLAYQQQREAVRTRWQRILDVAVGSLLAIAVVMLLQRLLG